MQVSFTLPEVAEITRPARTLGSTTDTVRGIAALGSALPGDISFLGNMKYKASVAASRASVVLLPGDYEGTPGPNQAYLFVDNASAALGRLCSRIEQSLWPRPGPGVHPSAVIGAGATVPPSATVGPHCVVEAGARVGERAHLQAGVFVGQGARIGDDTWLMAGATVCAGCELGRRVRLHPGAVIGADGFGYELVGGRHEKLPQVGSVTLGDDVEVGANSTIDRARFGMTEVGEGTKIDNLVQVGHNVVIGRHCIICALVGIAGSTTLGDYVVVGGQAGIAGHITIGSGVQIAAKSGIKDDIAPRTSVWGSPAQPILLEQKISILRNRLPELFRRVDALEKRAGKG
ncbi:MAG TPA: UDP-3-O-(3-hydroxymyristoyl)glucosamine N-acyltransferase [Opitutaceae bacterium]|jgi:UDP-3-O-[3-hydroxymyristoyl] glucosamine N-acyltransferase